MKRLVKALTILVPVVWAVFRFLIALRLYSRFSTPDISSLFSMLLLIYASMVMSARFKDFESHEAAILNARRFADLRDAIGKPIPSEPDDDWREMKAASLWHSASLIIGVIGDAALLVMAGFHLIFD